MRIYIVIFLLIICDSVVCQYNLSGKILKEKTREPVEYASVVIIDRALWAVTDEKGNFLIKNVAKGEVKISVSCLGYAQRVFTLNVTGTVTGIEFYLPEDNLALGEVVITAKSNRDAATSYTIDRKGLDHLQMLDVADVLSLLPGGRTSRNMHLATGDAQRIAIRGGTGEQGNSTFGTAVEADGVRLSNNAVFGGTASSTGEVYGVDTRNIATHNIESVEIVTGIPSVEYGDLTNGIVKINSRKGKSPLNIELSTKPNTKQASFSKGLNLIRDAGILNVSAEYTRSISDLASPFTSYERNTLSLIYEKTLSNNNQPLTVTAGLTGNIGGYDSQADPDSFKDTYTKAKDNTSRGNLKLVWLLNRSWITNLEISGAATYSDNLSSVKTNKSSSTSRIAIHGREEGYFVARKYDEQPDAPIVLIPAGYWYELRHTDSKPLNITAKIKAKWVKKISKVNSNLMLGIDYNGTANKGKGVYYDDLRYADTWREYRYDEAPFMHNISVYGEENLKVELGRSALKLTAGLRSDVTSIKDSEYGTVAALSPRFNVGYVREGLSVHAGWGKAVKLPSFSVLYPAPSYSDKLAFAPSTMADGTAFYAYHIRPYIPEYNPSLQWQYSQQAEAGFNVRLKGISLSLTFYRNKIKNAYTSQTKYTPFAYKLTDPKMLDGSLIPSEDRNYSIDRATGTVTVSDKTGRHPDETLDSREMRTFKSNSIYINGSPATQSGTDWILDFGKIPAIGTSIRLDGNYYHYRGTEQTVSAYLPVSQMMADGNPYKYMGFYAGGSSAANGRETKQLNTNVTFTTHIPAIRLIFSLRIEGALCDYTHNLSEYGGGQRSFALNAREDYFPDASLPDIYNNDKYICLYPLYYVSYEDMETKIPFAEKFAWARDNDRALFNELARLVVKTNTDYYFNASRLSAYYSANINITKEIGDVASISFNATNFTNNMQLIKSSDTGFRATAFNSRYIPKFYYGLSLRIKIK
jgi:outer membrane cobalamin receptor